MSPKAKPNTYSHPDSKPFGFDRRFLSNLNPDQVTFQEDLCIRSDDQASGQLALLCRQANV